MYNAILHIYKKKAITITLFLRSSPKIKKVNLIKQTIAQFTYFIYNFFTSCDFHLLTSYESGNGNLYYIEVKFLF